MLVNNIHVSYALAWLNLGTIALLPVLMTVVQLRTAIGTHIFEPSCPTFFAAAQQAPSIIHAYALQEIQVAADNIHRGLLVGISTIESVLLWFIGIYKSTYRCLLGLAVDGVISVVSSIASPVQNTAEHILQGIRLIDTAEGPTNSEASASPWLSGLTAVQDKIHAWANETSDPLEELVMAPFDAVKLQIARELGSYKPPPPPPSISALVGLDLSPGTQELSQIKTCDYPPAVVEAFERIRSKLLFLVNILLVAIAVLLVAATLIQLLFVWHQRRITQQWTHQAAQDIEALKARDGAALAHKLSTLKIVHQRPWLALVVRRRSIPGDGWLWNSWIYGFTHPMVLYCLIMGASGLLFIWLIRLMASSTQAQLQDTVKTAMQDHFAGNRSSIMALTDDRLATMDAWLAEAEADLNKHAFGAIQSIALTANTTVGVMREHISEFLTATLGGTLFEAPLRDVLDCLVMNKIDKIQQGLSWISEKSHVNLTRPDINQINGIILGDALLQGLEQPISDIHATFSQTVDEIIQVDHTFYTSVLLLWLVSLFIVILLHLSVCIKRKIVKK